MQQFSSLLLLPAGGKIKSCQYGSGGRAGSERISIHSGLKGWGWRGMGLPVLSLRRLVSHWPGDIGMAQWALLSLVVTSLGLETGRVLGGGMAWGRVSPPGKFTSGLQPWVSLQVSKVQSVPSHKLLLTEGLLVWLDICITSDNAPPQAAHKGFNN